MDSRFRGNDGVLLVAPVAIPECNRRAEHQGRACELCPAAPGQWTKKGRHCAGLLV